jgi:hypothetical protein
MKTRTRCLAVAAALVAFASPVHAQNLAVYGAAEAAGLGEGAAILGATLTPGQLGVNWLVGANVQTYRYRLTPSTTDQKVAFSPSVGLQLRAPMGAIQGTVGYNFTSGSAPTGVAGVAGGGTSSPTVGAQANYWGGIFEHEGIVSYATEPQYIWARGRLGMRPVPLVPLYLGGEFISQGGSRYGYRYQAGPTVNFHLTPNLHVGGSGGVRWNSAANSPTTGYVTIGFVALSQM